MRVESTEQVLAFKDRLTAAGVKTEDEMNTSCCYAIQDKVWVTDPTGYRWEIYVFKGDSDDATITCTECGHEDEAPATSTTACNVPKAVALVADRVCCTK